MLSSDRMSRHFSYWKMKWISSSMIFRSHDLHNLWSSGIWRYRPVSMLSSSLPLLSLVVSVPGKLGRLANSDVIIRGDVNFPDIDRENHCVKGTSGRPKALHESFLDRFLSSSPSVKCYPKCTHESRVLDLFIISMPGIVKSVNTIPCILTKR